MHLSFVVACFCNGLSKWNFICWMVWGTMFYHYMVLISSQQETSSSRKLKSISADFMGLNMYLCIHAWFSMYSHSYMQIHLFIIGSKSDSSCHYRILFAIHVSFVVCTDSGGDAYWWYDSLHSLVHASLCASSCMGSLHNSQKRLSLLFYFPWSNQKGS